MNVKATLDKFEKLLVKTIEDFTREHDIIIHKITIDGNNINFEVWSVNEEGGISIATYGYNNNRKNSIWGK